jgi:putative transposase
MEALEEALARHGKPDIFHTDQGSQFTSTEFIKVLARREIKICMPLGDCLQSPAGNRRKRGLARQRLRKVAMENHQI